MDHLKEGIGLRGYGQKDPLIEYKKESFTMFQDMMDRIEDETIKFLYFMRIEGGNTVGSVELPYPEGPDDEDEEDEGEPELVAVHAQRKEAQQSVIDLTRNIQRKKDRELAELQFTGADTGGQTQTVVKGAKPGRNELCPCGSGKKFKKCCGAAA
jgi:preprotein translocase subunit SecA